NYLFEKGLDKILKKVGEELNVPTYTEYDKFLEHDMDAVVLANFFNEHAPFALKALEAGKHVISETSCNATIADGVALCRAVEKSGLVYMLAENYPYMKFNQEMRKLYRQGEIGEVTYADGEYNHPMDARSRLRISPGKNHWRNHIPPTYYNTHALAPLMYITDTMPKKVNGLSIACREIDKETMRVRDPGGVILCRMDNGAVFRLFGLSLPGHSTWYRLHGSKGAMERIRSSAHYASDKIRIWHEEWDLEPGKVIEKEYIPEWPEHGELAQKAGHGGGDFWTNFYFAEAIRTGQQPYLDVYRGVTMSTVGILAWKSALQDGVPFDVPDFTSECERKKYENDKWSPFPEDAGPGQPLPSILGKIEPSEEAKKLAKEVWSGIGYKDVDNLV
ncbi:MAG TPA: Gfo/Idh/MocA family oxidoreductase, partial [Clostridiales bacterium]|nr:Gfo/Idh/MocA family oxidoreductase [Clostridiales bacterium]